VSCGVVALQQGVEVHHAVSLAAQQLESWGGPSDWKVEGSINKTGNSAYHITWTERGDYNIVRNGYVQVRVSSPNRQKVGDENATCIVQRARQLVYQAHHTIHATIK